jgi:hypothetical protein
MPSEGPTLIGFGRLKIEGQAQDADRQQKGSVRLPNPVTPIGGGHLTLRKRGE